MIDCPSLTQRGKSSADIHIVLDAVDALNHRTRYDEYIICSADADFSPLMTKLRRHDRRTVMVAASRFAPAYEAVCDQVIGSLAMSAAFTSPSDTATGQEMETITAVVSSLMPYTADDAQRAGDAVRDCVHERAAPTPGSTAAKAAMDAVPEIKAMGWLGAGGFAAFVGRYLPDLRFISGDSGGFVIDPTRQADTPAPNGEIHSDLITRVCRVTKVPQLSSEQYGVLFRELADAAVHQARLARIGADVRDRAAASTAPVPRKAVDFVVQGLVYQGVDPRSAGLNAMSFAERWRDNVFVLCEQAGLHLEDADRASITHWILGALI